MNKQKSTIYKISLFITALCTLLLQACEPLEDQAIRGVKEHPGYYSSEQNIGDHVKELAGLNGHIEWKSFRPPGTDFGPDIRVVETLITKKDVRGTDHNLRMQFIYNLNTGAMQRGYVEMDGKAQLDPFDWIPTFILYDYK